MTILQEPPLFSIGISFMWNEKSDQPFLTSPKWRWLGAIEDMEMMVAMEVNVWLAYVWPWIWPV